MRLLKVFSKRNDEQQRSPLVELRPVPQVASGEAWKKRALHLHHFLRSLTKISDYIGKNQSAVSSGVSEVLSRAESLQKTILSAEAEFLKSQEQMPHTKQGIAQNMHAINERSHASLQELSQVMEGQIGKASQVLNSIENIARELKIIVLNVSLEANRLGVAGDSIKAIALKIGHLAQDALTSAQKTKDDLDLDLLKSKLQEFQTQVGELTAKAERNVADSLDELEDSFTPLSAALLHIKNDQANIFEVRKIESQAMRARNRLEMLTSIAEEIDQSVAEPSDSPRAFFDSTEGVVRQSFGFSELDALEEIRKRGILRAAIEPSFVGLSFRHGSHELQGLDVDYAKAFAAWLGVGLEFVEGPWDQCPEFLSVPPHGRAKRADLMWSALIPDAAYSGIAFSNPYCKFEFVLARRTGDDRVHSLRDLDGLVLGCIADPAVYVLIENEGVRWSENRAKPGGRINLAKLQKYSDQTLIHDCLVRGEVDALLVDLPIYHWASSNKSSPWQGQIQIIDHKVGPDSFAYAVGVESEARNASLLKAVNRFLEEFAGSQQRKMIDTKWLGHEQAGTFRLKDFAPTVVGEDQLSAAAPDSDDRGDFAA